MSYQWIERSNALFTDGGFAVGALAEEITAALHEHVTDPEGLEAVAALDGEDFGAVGMMVVSALRKRAAMLQRRHAQEEASV